MHVVFKVASAACAVRNFWFGSPCYLEPQFLIVIWGASVVWGVGATEGMRLGLEPPRHFSFINEASLEKITPTLKITDSKVPFSEKEQFYFR